ncbi:hypothetical protein BCM14_2661 [Jezberella montanilacus]|uniref:Uncharacterized protein n=1 Tax=Jezberella montanilacus TaxID=323426 RepID=A0A2T0XDB2_9BURK|nr:hypothetical protein [Jezberella montanilacus]PRY96902.1 hypothetical protein BCM14_2661 [Jezberella montanilacus]
MEIKGVPAVGATTSGTSGQATSNATGAQFVAGHEYQAEVVSYAQGQVVVLRLQDGLVNVKLSGDVSAGQVVTLKYVGGLDVPIFEVVGSDTGNNAAYVAISRAATLIGQFLTKADSVPEIGGTVATGKPLLNNVTDPAQIAAELKQTLTGSGLFYESQLANLVLGSGAAEELRAQPQNTNAFDPAGLVSKQLEILESNAVRWAGTVWPGQVMQWTTQLDREGPADKNPNGSGENPDSENPTTVTSTMVLDLPKLKKIAATFKLRSDGALSVSVKAVEGVASSVLQPALPKLVDALTATGQKLESCLVSPHD